MDILTSIDGKKASPCVVVLGNFDGVHLAHRMLIEEAKKIAAAKGFKLCALIFQPYPAKILFPERSFQLLSTCEDQCALFADLGTDCLYQLPFDHQVANMSKERFVTEFLVPMMVRHVVVGFNYTFGLGGAGTADDLKNLGKKWGFEVTIVPAQRKGDKIISSTNIRKAIMAGEIKEAKSLLGYAPCLRGIVIQGEKRGRILGFPTANLTVSPDTVFHKNGVYAVRSTLNNETWVGMMNIGTKPTFHDHFEKTVEIHFLDYNGDLYGQELVVYIEERLRNEKKFSSVNELIDQLKMDEEKIRNSFKSLKIC